MRRRHMILVAWLGMILFSTASIADDDRWRCGRVVAESEDSPNPYRLEGEDGVTYRLLGMTSHDGVVLRYLRESLIGLMDLSRNYCIAGPERRVSDSETELRIYKVQPQGAQTR